MSDIQKARDVLAKWRDDVSSPLPWALHGNADDGYAAADDASDPLVWVASREAESSAGLYAGDDRLIVGTAGNPDLLDAIDFSLAYVQQALDLYEGRELKYVRVEDNGVVETALRIATAIIAADERMSA